jgi:hypothetical protein
MSFFICTHTLTLDVVGLPPFFLPLSIRVSAKKLSITLARKQLYSDIYSEVGKAASAQVANVEQPTGSEELAEGGAKSGTAAVDGSVEEPTITSSSRGRKRAAVEALRQEEQQVCMCVCMYRS